MEDKKLNEIKEYIKENKKENQLLMILHKIQDIYGYLPREVLELVSEEINIPLAKIYGVATFYSRFSLEKSGEYKINICMGTACFVKGADKVLEEFEKQLKIKNGETTPDGKITLESLRCVGACGLAPVVTVNDKVYGKVTVEQVKTIIEEYKG